MAKAQALHKLRLKFGDHEFEAEGSEAFVLRGLDAFRELRPGHGAPSPMAPERRGDADWDSLVREESAGGTLSLRVLPEGRDRQADTVLVLLLAYRRLRGQEEVPVLQLTEGMKRSGSPVARLDRALAAYLRQHVVLKSGSGKGGRYGLTNRGLKKAAGIAAELGSSVQ
jgi:hypothetical protein